MQKSPFRNCSDQYIHYQGYNRLTHTPCSFDCCKHPTLTLNRLWLQLYFLFAALRMQGCSRARCKTVCCLQDVRLIRQRPYIPRSPDQCCGEKNRYCLDRNETYLELLFRGYLGIALELLEENRSLPARKIFGRSHTSFDGSSRSRQRNVGGLSAGFVIHLAVQLWAAPR